MQSAAEPMCEVLLSPAEAILSKLKIKNQEDTDWTLRLDNRKKKRSATLCVARAVAECHGSLSLLLDRTSRITNYVNMSGLRIEDGDLISRYVGDLCSKSDQLVLETLIESQSDCSAELQLIFREFDLTAHVQAQHSFGTVRLECQISRVRRTDISTPQNSVENVVASDFNATLSPDPVVSTESISVCFCLLTFRLCFLFLNHEWILIDIKKKHKMLSV
uniref:MALT1 n=1 Tax=Heterorhabditis bacteriophora TaxID=37862 RepID=A0A1I7XD62_HETBA